jgi:glutaredoxin-related protein
MPRATLDEAHIHAAVRQTVTELHLKTVQMAQQAIAQHTVVVLGMGQNPFCKRVRKALDAAGVSHHDIDIGNYFSEWRPRTALKMWTGWPTFPMVFVKGVLVGGSDDVARLIASGELRRLLA